MSVEQALKQAGVTFSRVAFDSREVRTGDLFFALRGAKTDGHLFLAEAAARGAIAAVVEEGDFGCIAPLLVVRVDNTLAALQEMAVEAVKKAQPRVVAVTGSYGKTTTKDFIYQLLHPKIPVWSTPGNQNSQIGLPAAILNREGQASVWVLEMGMNQPGEIERLVQLAPPEVAVLTQVGLVHVAPFGSLEAIAREKSQIFSHPRTKKGFVAAEISQELIWSAGVCPKTSFAVGKQADYQLREAPNGAWIVEEYGNKVELPSFSLPGRHNLHNLLGAISVARYFGIPWESIQQTIPHLKLPKKRLEWVEKDGVHFLNDSYNGTMQAMKEAILTLKEQRAKTGGAGRLVAALGSMKELGTFCAAAHKEMACFAKEHLDQIFWLGEDWGLQDLLFLDKSKLKEALFSTLCPGDWVLVKGARSDALWELVEF